VFNNDKPKEIIETKVTSTAQEDIRKRELELKQRELALKEKELEKQKSQQPNLNSPEGVVTKFIQSLGNQDWSAAFGLMSEKRRGSYSTFSSTKGYGGITSTKIYSCSYTGESNGKKEVMVDYESIDPSNKSGRFKQYYYLTSFNDSYLITDIKNINIEWF
jgi:cold shock CspA family protein